MALTEEDLAKIALERFAPMATSGRLATYEEVASTLRARFNKLLDPATLNRAVGAAFRAGLVEIRRTEASFPDLPRQTDLEERLRDAFHVRRVIVVKLDEDLGRDGDFVNKALGITLARYLATIDVRDNESWGIGAGRACYRFSQEFRNQATQRSRNVTLFSLTGNFFVRSVAAREKNIILDADLNTYRTSQAWLDEAVKLELIRAPAVYADANVKVLKRNRNQSWLGSQQKQQSGRRQKNRRRRHGADGAGMRTNPQFAIVGAGILRESVWFSALAAGVNSNPELREAVSGINAACEKAWNYPRQPGLPPYCPIGDCANRLFVVPPPEGYKVPDKLISTAKALVAKVNRHILTVDWDRLKTMKLYAVAGGITKAVPLLGLLREKSSSVDKDNRDESMVHCLCTDAACAEALLTLSTR